MNILKFISFTLLSLISISAFASENMAIPISNDCLAIYGDSSFNDDFDKKTICNQDYAMNSLNMLFSHAYERSEKVRYIYEYFDMPAPPKATHGNSSALITTLSNVTVGLFLYIAVPASFIALLINSYKVLQSSSLSNEFKRPENWGSFAFFSLACILAYISDGFMFGQVLVIGVAGWALSFANLGLTAVAGFFTYSTSSSETLADPSDFVRGGEVFAVDIITSAMIARNSALVLNRANNKVEKVSILKSTPKTIGGDGILDQGIDWAAEFANIDRDDISPRVGDYFKNMLGASSTKITYVSPLWEVQNTSFAAGSTATLAKDFVGNVRPNVIVSLNPVSNSNNGDGLIQNYYKILNDEKAVFQDPHIAIFKGDNGLRYQKHLKALLSDDLYSSFSILDGLSEIPPTKTIENLGGLLKRKADKFAQKEAGNNTAIRAEIRDQYIKTAQANLLGLYNKKQIDDKNYNDVVEYFNPLDKSTIGKGKAKTPLYAILNDAFDAAEQMSAYNCTKMLINSNNYSDVFGEIRKNKLLKKQRGELASTAFSLSKRGYGQCFSLAGEEPIFLISDDVTKHLEPLSPYFSEKLSDQQIFSGFKKEKTLSAVVAANKNLTAARESKDNIVYYYTAVMAATRYALLKSKLSEHDEDQASIMTNMRQNGASALMAYFFRLNIVQDKFRDAFGVITPTESVNNIDQPETLLPVFKTKKIAEELALGFKAFGDDFRIPLLGTAEFGGVSALDINRRETTDSGSALSSYIIDMMLPGDDVLKRGFGFDEKETLVDNYKSCAMSSNCISFKQHPLVTMSQFGKDLVQSSVTVIIIDSVLQSLNSIDIAGYVDSIDDSMFGSIVPDEFSEKLKIAGKGAGVLWKILIGSLAIISSLAASFSFFLMAAGLALAYLLPIIPIMGQILLWISWVLEVLVLFTLFPILVGLMLIRPNGKPLLPLNSLVGMFASILLKPLLYVVVFVCYYTITYVAFYLINSVMFFVISDVGMAHNAGVVTWLLDAIGGVVSILMVIYLYFKILLKLNQHTLEIPELILNYIGVKGFKVAAVSGVEAMLTTAVISQNLTKSIQNVSGGVTGSISKNLNKMIRKRAGKGKGENEDNNLTRDK